MIKIILSDLSKVILFAKDPEYKGKMTDLYLANKDNPDYKFENFYYLNEEYLSILESYKEKFKLVLFTQGRMLEEPTVYSRVTKTFSIVTSSSILGFDKDNPEAFIKVAKDNNVDPDEVLFIDDDDTFLVPAKTAGLQTIKFLDNNKLQDALIAILG